MTIRFLTIQAVVACLFVAAWWQGWPQYMYNADTTRLTAVIAFIAVCGVIAQSWGKVAVVEYLIRALPRYGLFGTVVGIAIVAANSGGDFNVILGGMATAFFTTITGLLGAEWLRLGKALS